MWNSRSDLQAGSGVYHWGYLRFWLILGNQNDPLLGPQFHPPPSGQLAAPLLCAHEKPGPDFGSCTWI